MPNLRTLPKSILPLHLLLLSLLLLSASGLQADERILTRSQIQLEDGDTLLIAIDGKQQRIQLQGIDAPEDSDNPKLKSDLARTGLNKDRLLELGKRATDHLRSLIQADAPYTLHYQPDQRDRYGRLVGDLSNANGHNLTELMVAAGYAQVTVKSIDPERLRLLIPLQQAALDRGTGLWGFDDKGSRLWAGIETSN